jgi:putative spermidine/putrescine transport system substrate-binding protein
MTPQSNVRSGALLSALAILTCGEVVSAAPSSVLVAAARAERQLNVIALPRDWCGYGSIIDGFEAKYGLTVNELSPEAGSEDQIEAIRATRGPADTQAPDVIDVGLAFGPAAKKAGLLQPYKVSSWTSIPDAVKDPDGYWYGDYYGVLVFQVNADVVENAPSDWPDLLKAGHRVALGGDPKASNQAFLGVFAAGLSMAQGDVDQAADQGLRFFADLHNKGNFVPVVGDAETLTQGAAPILIRWDYLALGDRDRLRGSPKVNVVVPKTGVVAGVYVQAISASAPHPNAAKLWMEYLYSDEAQLALLNGYCRPIRLKDLLRDGKVPVRLLQEFPDIYGSGDDHNGDHREPVFPTIEELERAKNIIIRGWDDLLPDVQCEQHDSPASSVPMSSNDAVPPFCTPT